jgi:hypothetical protein
VSTSRKKIKEMRQRNLHPGGSASRKGPYRGSIPCNNGADSPATCCDTVSPVKLFKEQSGLSCTHDLTLLKSPVS